jgi:hypothetical protein
MSIKHYGNELCKKKKKDPLKNLKKVIYIGFFLEQRR